MKETSKTGYLLGSLLAVLLLGVLAVSTWPWLDATGPANVGHEALACGECHDPAPGTARQQIQANLRHALGQRRQPVDFGYQAVGNQVCLDCHERPGETHPVFRFNEPRFADARAAIAPQLCGSCHLEHTGLRVTAPDLTFCLHCHSDVDVKSDPIAPSHAELAAAEDWTSCLACHDYHGNHVRETTHTRDTAVSTQDIRDYFTGQAPSPYGSARQTSAKETRHE